MHEFTILLATAEEFSHLWPSLNLLLGHDHSGGSYFEELGPYILAFSRIQQ